MQVRQPHCCSTASYLNLHQGSGKKVLIPEMQPLKKEDSIYKGHFPIVFHVVKKTRVTFDYGLDFS